MTQQCVFITHRCSTNRTLVDDISIDADNKTAFAAGMVVPLQMDVASIRIECQLAFCNVEHGKCDTFVVR